MQNDRCLYYFAYGSNMATERLTSRIPGAEKFANGRLPGYVLSFHKVGKDGSGKCDVVRSDAPDAVVYGVLFRLQESDFDNLDRIEGSGYRRVSVDVMTDTGATVAAATYVATNINAGLHPYSWYKEHVLRGAAASGLPATWIAMLESVACAEDPDRERHTRELAIYSNGTGP